MALCQESNPVNGQINGGTVRIFKEGDLFKGILWEIGDDGFLHLESNIGTFRSGQIYQKCQNVRKIFLDGRASLAPAPVIP